jgi:hypothetical protein
MASYAAVCERCCVNKTSAPEPGVVKRTMLDGPMPSSRLPGCSPFTQLGKPSDIPDEETVNWRAVCGDATWQGRVIE